MRLSNGLDLVALLQTYPEGKVTLPVTFALPAAEGGISEIRVLLWLPPGFGPSRRCALGRARERRVGSTTMRFSNTPLHSKAARLSGAVVAES